MVLREDGTKWACHSCLKGHRVSGCNHTDRELVQVPKKGRPVTQCQHCRQERKKRSAHVSCECGDAGKHHHPREKCIHLREAEERAKAGYHDEPAIEKDPNHLFAVAEEQGCCCHHGGRCSCAILKKESDDPSAPHGPAVKPRLEKTTSESSVTHFVNGHHKPVHRKNHAAHEHGMPYRLPVPRSNSEQSTDSNSSTYTESHVPDLNPPYQQEPWLPLTSAPFSTERRLSKSEQTSPKLNPSQPFLGGLPSLTAEPVDFADLTAIRTNESLHSAASSTGEFPPFDQMSGFSEDELDGLDPWMDMSALDTTTIKPNQNTLQSWSSCSPDAMWASQPGMTTPSSGPQSESDDVASVESIYGGVIPSMQCDTPFSFDTGNPESPQGNRRSLPPGFFGNTNFNHGAGGMTSEWQTAVANAAATHGMVPLSASPSHMESVWQQPLRNPMGTSPLAFENSPFASRPQSRSVGPNSAPSNDVLRELFPDIDVDNISQSHPQVPTRKTFSGMPASLPTSAPVTFEQQQSSQANIEAAMAPQPWTNGLYSVSYDNYIPSANYESEQAYTSQTFAPDWSQ